MKTKYLVIFNFLIIMCFLTVNCKKSTLITYNGGSISEKDIQEASSSDLFDLKEQEYQIKRNYAYALAKDKIVKIEAESLKVTPDALLDDYLKKNYQPAVEGMAKDYYEQNKDRIQQPYESIKVELLSQLDKNLQEQTKSQYYQELFKKYNVQFVLPQPEMAFVKIDIADEPFWGQANAKVTVVEYSDFECPYCQRVQPEILKIKKDYEGKIKWVFKDFPLSFHQQAKQAHIAANCAQKQNKFFEFQTELFNAHSDLSINRLNQIAGTIGLNLSDFKLCLEDKNNVISQEIEKDIADGVKYGVKGTPTFFVNGKKQNGFRDYQSIKDVLDEALK